MSELKRIRPPLSVIAFATVVVAVLLGLLLLLFAPDTRRHVRR